MKLNPDCIRDILIELERSTDGQHYIDYQFKDDTTSFPLTKKYSAEEIFYHIRQCEYSGFFINPVWTLDNSFSLLDISPEAHQFIENIRSQNVWEKVKKIASAAGSLSINVLFQIAREVVTSNISALLNH